MLTNAEAVEIDLRPARLGSRALALLFDILTQAGLVLALLAISSIVLSMLPGDVVDTALLDTGWRVVLIAVVFMTALIFGFDYGSSKLVLFLFD